MKEFYKLRNYEVNSEDLNCIAQLGFDEQLCKLIINRGINRSNVKMHFSKSDEILRDPYLMKGMAEAIELIKKVSLSGGKVLIYGDYDADGISAAAILKLYFDKSKIKSRVVLPVREDGYGLHFEIIEREYIKETFDLLLTVDCGISNKVEIDKIKSELCIDVIVTDHHELPNELPNCICINPKIDYEFKMLSGSGVAFKIVQAMSDKKTAKEYAALAMIGTIADMMPIVDENRAIIRIGLERIEHSGLKGLIDVCKCSQPYTVYDFSMKICPKINAAGRVGDPTVALKVLLGDKKANSEAIKKLILMNEERKSLLDYVIMSADSQINKDQLSENHCVFVKGNWKQGILGIVASRYKEMYKLPALVMTYDDGKYIGSGRSIDEINLYECFSNVKECLLHFGGHKASVGFAVEEDKLELFKERISAEFRKYEFTEIYEYYDIEYNERCSSSEFCQQLQLLEPLSVNERVIFHTKGYAVSATSFGNGSHLSVKLDNGLYLKGFFEYGKYKDILEKGGDAEYLFTIEYDKFEKTYVGIIKSMRLLNSIRYDDEYVVNYLMNYGNKNQCEELSMEECIEILKRNNITAIFMSHNEFESFAKNYEILFDEFREEFFYPTKDLGKKVLIAPKTLDNIDKTAEVVWFYSDTNYHNDGYIYPIGSKIFNINCGKSDYLRGLNIDRDLCSYVYKAIKGNNGFYSSWEEMYLSLPLYECSKGKFLAVLKILNELGLIKITKKPFEIKILNGVRNELTNSELFLMLREDKDNAV
ncbi:MAG: DHH family phosphoesterase [Clostridia bacterium]